ncbi:MAG: hypothetical protein JWO12_873 [Frankiales bacterium]|jgi:hypothetical protein|nr:hypothetical protein [Frankiales bacterium]
MGWQDLVCAACAGRVVDGRCPSCRAARDHFRSTRTMLPAGPLLALAAVLLALLVILSH